MKNIIYLLIVSLVIVCSAACSKNVEQVQEPVQNQEQAQEPAQEQETAKASGESKTAEEVKSELPMDIIDEIKADMEGKGWSFITAVNGPLNGSQWSVLWANSNIDGENPDDSLQYNVLGEYVDESKKATYAIVNVSFETRESEGKIARVIYINEAGRSADSDYFKAQELLPADDSALQEYMSAN